MTTDPHPSPDAAGEAASTPVTPAAEPPQVDSAEGAPAEGQAKPRIKIGTQRPGVVAPRVQPRSQVAYHTKPRTESDQGNQTKTPQAAALPPAKATPAPPTHQADPARAPAKRSGRKPRIEVFAPPTEKVEPPNSRAALSPELEAELEAALGNESLDRLLDREAAGTPSGDALEPESRHHARVVRVHRDNVFVEFAGRNQGVLSLQQFAAEPAADATLEVIVVRFNPEEGLYELSVPGSSVDVGDWSDLAEGIVVEARVTGHNQGGLECEVNNLRGFIPGGQISLYRVENFDEFVGQRWPCVVIEADAQRRKLVLSRRAVLEREQAEAKEQLLSQLEVGQVREGVVRTVRDFGAFVDLGGIDGLIHVSQLSWDRVKHPSDVVQVGQSVKVKINRIDPDTRKISLGYRDLFDNPWDSAVTKYPVSSTVKGTVSKIMDFGAFVKIEPGIEGLVHISELSHRRVFRAADVVQEGQEVEAKVLAVDPEKQRISLSMKAIEGRYAPTDEPQAEQRSGATGEQSAPAKAPSKKHKVPLQGGLGRSPMRDKFGLRW